MSGSATLVIRERGSAEWSALTLEVETPYKREFVLELCTGQKLDNSSECSLLSEALKVA